MEFTFKHIYRLADDDATHADLVERLGDAGCNDALVGIGRPGYIALEFAREADNALAAEASAIADVKRAIPSATPIEAGPAIGGEPRDNA